MQVPKHTAILIDDEPDATEQLSKLLAEYEQIQIIETFQSTGKALISVVKINPACFSSMWKCPGRME